MSVSNLLLGGLILLLVLSLVLVPSEGRCKNLLAMAQDRRDSLNVYVHARCGTAESNR